MFHLKPPTSVLLLLRHFSRTTTALAILLPAVLFCLRFSMLHCAAQLSGLSRLRSIRIAPAPLHARHSPGVLCQTYCALLLSWHQATSALTTTGHCRWQTPSKSRGLQMTRLVDMLGDRLLPPPFPSLGMQCAAV